MDAMVKWSDKWRKPRVEELDADFKLGGAKSPSLLMGFLRCLQLVANNIASQQIQYEASCIRYFLVV